MRKFITCSLIALGVTAAAPAFAQGIYLGPNGVGVDTGARYHRDYDRYDRRDNDRGYYEGRSAYRDDGYRHRRDDY